MADDLLIKVDVGDVSAALLRWEGNAGRLSSTMQVVAGGLKAAVGDVFEAEGPGWQELAESTKQSRRGEEPYKILQDTGIMSSSIGTGWGPAYAEAFGGAAYTIFHVTGNANLPVRDPFDLGPFLEDVMADAADLVASAVAT